MTSDNLAKLFISANDLTADSFKLAEKIYRSGFRPNKVLSLLRGGAPIGITIQEYLCYKGEQVEHLTVSCSSYSGIANQSDQVRVEGMSLAIENINPGDKLLIVDDVFDSGRSVDAVLAEYEKQLEQRSVNKNSIRSQVATVWFKPLMNRTDREPDYYLRTTEQWLVFPHELIGLSSDEIATHKPDAANTAGDPSM